MRKGRDQYFMRASKGLGLPESVVNRKLINLNLTSYSISSGIKYKF